MSVSSGWLVRLMTVVLVVAGISAAGGTEGVADVRATSSMFGQDEDDEEAGDEDAGDVELVGVDDNTYESPTWGFTLEWNEDDWEATEATSEDEVDELVLTSGRSTILFSAAAAHDGDPDECLEEWVGILSSGDGVEDWVPIEDEEDEEIAGEEDDRAWAAFSLTDEVDGSENAEYIECRTLVEDEATLTIVHFTTLDDYFDEAELVADVLDTIEVADTGDANGGGEEDLLADVETYEVDDLSHTEEDVDYPQTPPVGGPHRDDWQNCGFYDEPVEDELAVHSLEHGAVWITYDPDLPEDEVEILQELAEDHAYVLVSPYPDLPAPVVASAWGAQLLLDGADDPRLEAFVDYYEEGPQTPEPGASCSGSISETVD